MGEKRMVSTGRLMLLFRNLHWNLTHGENLLGLFGRRLAEQPEGFGVAGLVLVPCRYVGLGNALGSRTDLPPTE